MDVEVKGFMVTVTVTHYSPTSPMVVTGTGWGDCLPPEPEEIEFIARYPDGTEVEDSYVLSLISENLT